MEPITKPDVIATTEVSGSTWSAKPEIQSSFGKTHRQKNLKLTLPIQQKLSPAAFDRNNRDMRLQRSVSTGEGSEGGNISLLSSRRSSIDYDERSPTFMVPDVIEFESPQQQVLKSSTPVSQPSNSPTSIEKRRLSNPLVSAFSKQNSCSHLLPNSSSPTHLEADWGDDNEWIMLFDKLLNSSAGKMGQRQCECVHHGKFYSLSPWR